jgi:hypothetical protein
MIYWIRTAGMAYVLEDDRRLRGLQTGEEN